VRRRILRRANVHETYKAAVVFRTVIMFTKI
jgi:hypothetical protein